MKFKQPKSHVPTISLISGTIAGAMLSRIGYSVLPKAKESSTETAYKGAIMAVAGVGAAFVDGNDAVSNMIRGAFIGASVEQGLSLIKGIAQDAKTENKLIKQAVGLACPCQERKLGNPQQVGRIIPLRTSTIRTSTGDFNPYQDRYSTHYSPPPGSIEWEYEKIKQIQKDLEEKQEELKAESLASQTTI